MFLALYHSVWRQRLLRLVCGGAAVRWASAAPPIDVRPMGRPVGSRWSAAGARPAGWVVEVPVCLPPVRGGLAGFPSRTPRRAAGGRRTKDEGRGTKDEGRRTNGFVGVQRRSLALGRW